MKLEKVHLPPERPIFHDSPSGKAWQRMNLERRGNSRSVVSARGTGSCQAPKGTDCRLLILQEFCASCPVSDGLKCRMLE
jgi:hypothetical protein